MTENTTTHELSQQDGAAASFLFDDWSDPIEASIRERVWGFFNEMIQNELETALGRVRYARRWKATPSAALPEAGSAGGTDWRGCEYAPKKDARQI